MLGIAILMALTQTAAPPSHGALAADPIPSGDWTAAAANRQRVKTPPSFKIEPAYLRPAEAKARGEFGVVVLEGIIGKDGLVREARVKIGSQSAAIDAAALTAAGKMLFEPARDAEGNPIEIVSAISLEFTQVEFEKLGEYRCDQFVRDYDWWHRSWPADKHDRVFLTLQGFVVVAEKTFYATDFAAEWNSAIEACRAKPGASMLDALKPHGKLIRGMVRDR